jgi:PAS domain S-box-containing protein
LKWSIETKIGAGFAVVLVVMAAVAVITFQNTFGLINNNRWVAHTHEVLQELELTLSTITHAETSQRGYIITGDRTYLESYLSAVTAIPAQIAHVKDLTADNPIQQQRIPHLQANVKSRLDALQAGIDARSRLGFEAAQQLILAGTGTAAMTAIRKTVGDMENEEASLLKPRTADAETSATNTILIFVFLMVLIVALLGFVFYLVRRDIRERKRAQEDLSLREERHRTLLASLPQLVFFKDRDSAFVSVNAAFAEDLGMTPEDVIGKTDYDIHPRESADRFRADEQRIMATRQPETREQVYISGGRQRVLEVVKTPVINDAGEVVGIFGLSSDISERKQSEAEIRTLNEDLERRVAERTTELENMNRELESEITRRERAVTYSAFLVEAASILASSLDYEETLTSVARLAVPKVADWCNVDVVDEDGQVRRVALAHADPAKEEMARDYLRKHPPEPNADRGVDMVLRTGKSIVVPEISKAMLEQSARDPETLALLRELRPTSSMTVPLIAHGHGLGAITLLAAESGVHYGDDDLALAEEIAGRAAIAIENARLYRQSELARDAAEAVGAELKQTVAELARSNDELQQFAYVASHDLQEPLRMVASYTQLLSKRYKGRLDDEFIAYAVDGANRMQSLINDLLAYSRVSSRGVALEPTNSDLVLGLAVSNLRAAIDDSHAEISHDPLPTIMSDHTQLLQLFQNLIGNAIKFRGDKPPRVHIGVERKDSEWIFSVRDDGIGMDLQYADRIFVIFQRLHSKAEYPGTGIGLSVCKKVVERHGGRIWVQSELGAGSTFYFTLPGIRDQEDEGGRPSDRRSGAKTVRDEGSVTANIEEQEPVTASHGSKVEDQGSVAAGRH